MPPLRPGRASKACDLCRKQKTRCYESTSSNGSCLRCETLSQQCSLELSQSLTRPGLAPTRRQSRNSTINSPNIEQPRSVNDRLERLERTIEDLVNRLDSKLDDSRHALNHGPDSHSGDSESPIQLDPAPVSLLRNAATRTDTYSSQDTDSQLALQTDVISSGLVSASTAHVLLELFHLHYGRWIRFPENIPTEKLLLLVRKSPLLICSIFLIAVRHTTQELADRLAPKLLQEAKRLITTSLLRVPQPIEFFQAALILGLWSTTIGQVPLSIDSWLLTGYAIQQALASPHFAEVLQSAPHQPSTAAHLDSWCLWNHICAAHLQYCVGTRRQALLNQDQIDRCINFIKSNSVTNYEQRMVAEVQLYWIIYNKCSLAKNHLVDTKLALEAWQREWMRLFNEPRSQFLQMGFHFAHLLAYCQSLKSPKSVMHSSILKEIVRHSRGIINLAIDTTDERTRHLTDHIYHILSFSALTLCRIVQTYEPNLRAASYEIAELDNLVFELINWLKSIGPPCHAAHILGEIVLTQFRKIRPNYFPTPQMVTISLTGNTEGILTDEELSFPADPSLMYSNFVGWEMFDMDAGESLWPEWARSDSDTDRPV